MLSMAQRLGLRIVAEGVETEEQAAFLRQHRCPTLQGHLFGRPTPAPLWLDQARSKIIDRSANLVTQSY